MVDFSDFEHDYLIYQNEPGYRYPLETGGLLKYAHKGNTAYNLMSYKAQKAVNSGNIPTISITQASCNSAQSPILRAIC